MPASPFHSTAVFSLQMARNQLKRVRQQRDKNCNLSSWNRNYF